MKKIISIHPVYNLEKGYFNRDNGQIGYTISKNKGYQSEFWCLKKKGQKDFIIKGQKWKGFKNIFLLYYKLLLNSKKIDILHQYHIFKYSFIGLIIYKVFNKKGLAYIKMDMPLYVGEIDNRISLNNIPKFIMIIFLKLVDYIGFEDKILKSYMEKLFPNFKNKFILTTSGAIKINKYINNLQKENIIVLCGRFGAKEKNYELFLDMLLKCNIDFLNNWSIYLVGAYTDEFEILYKKIIEEKNIYNKIHLTGFIENKEDIYKIISKAKIFIHTSNYEGDPNIQYDAMFCGCYMISTDVGNIKQNYPKNFASFYKVNSYIGLYNILKIVLKKLENTNIIYFYEIQKYCLKNFIWDKSLKQILDKI